MPSEFNWPIIGHKKIVNFLQRAIGKDQLSHAYIFYGVTHLGKKTIAKLFAKSILCAGQDFTVEVESPRKKVPCETCVHCRQINYKVHPDLVIIKRLSDEKTGKLKKNISIEQIREMRDKLSHTSFLKNYKIAIIEDVDALSIGAANGLLKILEEPMGKTVFILLTSNLEKTLKTVVSRCQKINFLPVAFSDIYDFAVQNKKINRTLAMNVAALAQGRPGKTEYFAATANLQNYYKKTENYFNLLTQAIYQRFNFVSELMPKTAESEEQKEVALDFFFSWQTLLRDCLLIKNSPLGSGSKVKIINNNFGAKLKKSFSEYDNVKLINLLDKIKQGLVYLESNASPKLILENFMLSL